MKLYLNYRDGKEEMMKNEKKYNFDAKKQRGYFLRAAYYIHTYTYININNKKIYIYN